MILARSFFEASPHPVVIDDMDRNLEAARALGLLTIRFEGREQCAAELSRLLGEPFLLAAPLDPS